MAFQQVTNGAEVLVKGDLDGEDAFITLGFSNPAAWGEPELLALALGVQAWFITNMIPTLPTLYIYRETVATDLRTQGGFEQTAAGSTGAVGQRPGLAMPNNVTLAISFRTGRTGRSYRGRNYIQGLVRDSVVANRVAQWAIDSFIDGYNALIGPGAVAVGWHWGVISRRLNNAPRPFGIITPIREVTVTDATIDSQRRRLPGRGD